jgi:triacylglycerol lipase
VVGSTAPTTTTTTTTTTTPIATPTSTRTDPDRVPPASPAPPAGTTTSLPAVRLPGVNDPSCRSDDPPVVLLHGSFSTLATNFGVLVPALRADGRCVYGLNYGDGGIGPVADSARAAARLVATVRARTGAPQVDVVGFSQGGLVLRTALRLDGLAPLVRVAVLIAPSFHGTTSPLASALPRALCPACADQQAGSALLTRLDAGGDLDGSVRYAVISTDDDTVVTPLSAQVPNGPTSRVRSLVVQQRCPGLPVDHVALPGLPGVVAWVVAALQTDGRPPATALSCP